MMTIVVGIQNAQQTCMCGSCNVLQLVMATMNGWLLAGRQQINMHALHQPLTMLVTLHCWVPEAAAMHLSNMPSSYT